MGTKWHVVPIQRLWPVVTFAVKLGASHLSETCWFGRNQLRNLVKNSSVRPSRSDEKTQLGEKTQVGSVIDLVCVERIVWETI